MSTSTETESETAGTESENLSETVDDILGPEEAQDETDPFDTRHEPGAANPYNHRVPPALPNDYPEPPELVQRSPILFHRAWRRMHIDGQNFAGAVIGETGIGKSWGAIRIAEALDPDFSIDQVAFGVEDFLELVIDESYGQGSVIVFEEASVEAGHREWYSLANRILKQVLETWRHQNRGVLFTLPDFDKLDKSARARCHAMVKMIKKNESSGYSEANWRYLQTNVEHGEIYKHPLQVDGVVHRRVRLRKPSKGLREAYERKKESYTKSLNEGLLSDFRREKKKRAKQDGDSTQEKARKIAKDILNNGDVEDYVNIHPMKGTASINKELIMADYDVSHTISKIAKSLVKRDANLKRFEE